MNPIETVQDIPRTIKWNELDGVSYSIYGSLYILITDFILYPADLITTRLQADKVKSIHLCLSKQVRKILVLQDTR